jgi:hypothetical protein
MENATTVILRSQEYGNNVKDSIRQLALENF